MIGLFDAVIQSPIIPLRLSHLFLLCWPASWPTFCFPGLLAMLARCVVGLAVLVVQVFYVSALVPH